MKGQSAENALATDRGWMSNLWGGAYTWDAQKVRLRRACNVLDKRGTRGLGCGAMADVDRLFKLPRHPKLWPLHRCLILALLAAALAVVLWLGIFKVRPGTFPPTDEANQWAAEAVVIGGGALVFAIVATLLATLAYINSTEKPSLRPEAH